MAFKVKNKIVKKNIDSRITLDAKYNDTIFKINNYKNKILNNEKLLNELNIKYTKLCKNYKKNIDQILDIKDKMIELKDSIKMSNKNEDINYLLNTGHILFDYYDNIENKKNSNNVSLVKKKKI